VIFACVLDVFVVAYHITGAKLVLGVVLRFCCTNSWF